MAKRVYLNLDLCCGCRSCAAACAYGHHIQSLLGHSDVEGAALLPLHCLHCDQPACAAACPNEAMKKMQDGMVLRSHFKCVGCSSCDVRLPVRRDPAGPQKAHCAQVRPLRGSAGGGRDTAVRRRHARPALCRSRRWISR